jgi:hypothetical protein
MPFLSTQHALSGVTAAAPLAPFPLRWFEVRAILRLGFRVVPVLMAFGTTVFGVMFAGVAVEHLGFLDFLN